MVTTNGKVLAGNMEKKISAIFNRGVDFIVLDTYKQDKGRLLAELSYIKSFKVIDYFAQTKYVPYYNYRRKLRNTVFLMGDIAENTGDKLNRTIWNHAGNSRMKPALTEPLQKMCAIPFRELSTSYNGDVSICCMDWGREYLCGNLLSQTAEEVWFGSRFEAARSFLRNNMRLFTPCARCDHSFSSRIGLIKKYDKPGPNEKKVVEMTVTSGKHHLPKQILF
jgi:hypothetical protein